MLSMQILFIRRGIVIMASSKYAAFIAAAEAGNMTEAAAKLGYTQSGVSRLVHTLEAELGLQLLVRSKSGVRLSPDGMAMLPLIKRLIAAENDVASMADEIRGLSSTTLRIGTFSSVAIAWLPELMSRFNSLYPGVKIFVENGTYSTVEDLLSEGNVDCAFVTLPSRPQFNVTPLIKDRLMAVVHPKSELALKPSLTAHDLSAQPFIVPAEGTNYDVGKFFSLPGIEPKAAFDMGDDYAACAMVAHGLGFTILPELMLKAMSIDSVAAVPLENSERVIGLAMSASYNSAVLRFFLSFVKEYVETGMG